MAAADELGFSGVSHGSDAPLKTVNDEQTVLLVRVAAIRAFGQTLYTSK